MQSSRKYCVCSHFKIYSVESQQEEMSAVYLKQLLFRSVCVCVRVCVCVCVCVYIYIYIYRER